MAHWLDEYEKDALHSRKLAREGACEENYWIKPKADGSRLLSPYHCGSCGKCLDRQAESIQAKLQSIAMLNDLRLLVAKPQVVTKLIKVLPTDDYVRFPCADGFDRLFSVGGPGKNVLDSEIDYKPLARRRPNTRKSGNLITMSIKKERGNTIEIFNIKATSRAIALLALDHARKEFEIRRENNVLEETVNDAGVLSVYNNMVNMSISSFLEDNNGLVFQNLIKVEYELPIEFNFNCVEERYFDND